MSPDDQFEDVVQKIRDYFGAGTEEVWIVLPRQKAIYRCRRGESQVKTYSQNDEMDVGTPSPGLTLSLDRVFALPDLR